jgi:NAD kinase
VGNRVPRIVLITRPTDLEALLMRHGTHAQARFFLDTRGQRLEELEERHRLVAEVLQTISRAIPLPWRRMRLDRSELASFVFEPEDLILIVGQDGLVANAAKYLEGQLVLGINPDPQQCEGLLVSHRVEAAQDLLQAAASGRVKVEERTMAEARLDDGQVLLALNELFLGHRSHQSARYRICLDEREERQSSSGLIVATGTGASGWAKSIHHERHTTLRLPAPVEGRLAFFVREAWPSRSTQAELTEGLLEPKVSLAITSEMNEDGVIFGDGIEADRLEFPWGQRAVVKVAERKLRLVMG